MVRKRRISKFYEKNRTAEKGFLHREHRSKKGRTPGARNLVTRRYKKIKEELKYEYDQY